MSGPVQEGKRWTTLNDRLVRVATFCDDFDALLDIAHSHNKKFEPPLEEREVVQCATTVWKDCKDGKIERWLNRSATVTVTANQICAFLEAGGTGDAWLLWQFLQTQHAARVKRGETFSFVCAKAAEAQCLPGWTEGKYRRHFEHLREIGFVQTVRGRTFKDGKFPPNLYKLKLAKDVS